MSGAEPPRAGRRPKLSESISDDIAEQIVGGRWAPGELLPNEADMMASYGVSRGTLREALRLVESHGLVRMRAGRDGGPVARRPDPSRLAYSFSLALRGLGVSFAEVLDSRQIVEPALAAQAARHRDEEQVARLRALQAELEAVLDDEDAFSTANEAFHTLLADAARNRPLAMLWAAISAVADGHDAGARYDADTRRGVIEAHARILAAVIARDEAAAERAMTRHLSAQRAYLEAHQPDLLARPVPALTRGS